MPVWVLIGIVFFLLWRDERREGTRQGTRFGGEYYSPDGSIRIGGAAMPLPPRFPTPGGFESQRGRF